MERIEAPDYLWLLAIVPILVILWLIHIAWKKRVLRELGDRFAFASLVPRASQLRPVVKGVLILLALVCLSLGIANPQTGSRMETVKREGVDIIFAVDVSLSMLAEDVKPSRLDRARQLVSACIDRLGGDRVGIIAYAGQAFPQLPVTTDLAAARLFLEGIGPDQISVQGTAISDAVRLSAEMFDEEGEQARILVLLSDGEDHEGEVEEAAQIAAENGIRIMGIGLGRDRGGPIPIKDAYGRTAGFKEDKDGNKVVTKRDERLLTQVARKSNGKYLDGNDTRSAVDGLMEELAALERSEFESSLFTDYEDQFYWFAGLALLLLIADTLILEKKTKWFDRWLQ